MDAFIHKYELKTVVYNLLEEKDYSPLELMRELKGFEYKDAMGYKNKVGEYNKQCNYFARLRNEYMYNKMYFIIDKIKKEDNNEEIICDGRFPHRESKLPSKIVKKYII